MDFQQQKAFAERVMERLDRLDREQLESFIQRLLRERRLAVQAMDHVPLGLALCDSPGRFLYLNPAARRLLGLEDERRGAGETVGRALRDEFLQPLLALWEDYREHPRAIERVTIPLKRGRKKLLLEVSLIPLGADGNSPAPAAAPLQTLWMLADAGRRRNRADETERSRYLEFFATLTTGLAHEIRNPLNSLSIHAALLRQGVDRLAALPAPDSQDSPPVNTERLQRSAHVLLEELERLKEIVNLFLLAARPMKLDLRPTRVADLFAQIADLLRPSLENTKIGIEVDCDPDLPPIPLDRTQFMQALLNLAKNGIEAMDPAVEGRLTLHARLDGDRAILEISDTGHGIPEEDRARIFEPYYTTKEQGTGLGLMVVWRIVKAHGGAIALDSAVGKGTTFTLALPLGGRPPLRLLPGEAQPPAARKG